MKYKPSFSLKLRNRFAVAVATASTVVFLFSGDSAQAAIYYWDTTPGTWQTSANWSDNATTGGTTGVAPTSTDTAVFNQSSVNGNETISLSGDTSVLGMTTL
ncbi:MAG: hypothetical protein ABIT76_05605 [Chthoniobacterales bacterium]